MDDLLADFLTETNEGLAALDGALLKLEKAPDDRQTLSEIFRNVHTIKGTCGFLGLSRLEKVAHAAENVLGRYRDGSLKVTPAGITLILSALDCLKGIVSGLEGTGSEPAGDDTALIAALDAAWRGAAPGTPAAAPPAAPPEADPFELPAGEPVAAAPPAPQAAAPEPPPAASAPSASAPPAAPAHASRGSDHEGEAAGASGGGGASGPITPAQTIRVSVDVLEDLMTLVSELVLTRNQLLQLVRARSDAALTVPLQRLSHITSELQEGVMKTRMQPIGNAWQKLPRIVRDLANELGKKIELVMKGADTELDRQVLELIKDPLTHMVRNSGDHGLETPEQRRQSGKPETGRILLNAYHEGGHIIIEIGDDGRGLPAEKIKQKALAQGLATEAEIAGMGEREIQHFIFRAGFSTAAAVTSVSGRGVGMDVVKTNVEKIGGTIELRSVEGRGTTFYIKIPLTLAIVSALIVEAGGERFAIPQIGVVELVRAGGSAEGAQIERIHDTPVMRLRDRLLPLVSLSRLLELPQAADEGRRDAGFVVVTQVGANVFGIIVDKVFDTEEIVVKPVAPILRHVAMFSGNTILGDGSVIMILDPNGIARATGVGADGPSEDAARGPEGLRGHRSTERTALLLFRAGDGTPKAVPLGLVARLEDLPGESIEHSGGKTLVQYRGKLMPLVAMAGGWAPPEPGRRQAVLVFNDRDRAMGLMVDAILDVVEEHLLIEGASEQPGFLGSAVICGKVTDVIDCAWWLHQAGDDWFRGNGQDAVRRRVLLVEDSAFFRHLLVPGLTAAGYDVTAVDTGMQALRLREQGAAFDVIISDIEMPDLDGIGLARAVRESGAWQPLPMIALSGKVEAEQVRRAREAGFNEYVGKSEREALLAALSECLATPAIN
ncbi:hybrid sensor histidine kinase/response regulator [Pseudoroseomonas rhizosphaerae]|uniref:Chemotaxis protein CheA n=1 Tax=Teichococcus rhizosphaerae TaxID=1335062 RepID=A0A2C7AA92_9PROT|nr:chemotaxis protein CheW [Pseudoroseomonas rhizosphaerae]PHK94949.1 hybrid sensor histidine kinase/response regulator [Pseudoroseomonas rhizosphaerae]